MNYAGNWIVRIVSLPATTTELEVQQLIALLCFSKGIQSPRTQHFFPPSPEYPFCQALLYYPDQPTALFTASHLAASTFKDNLLQVQIPYYYLNPIVEENAKPSQPEQKQPPQQQQNVQQSPQPQQQSQQQPPQKEQEQKQEEQQQQQQESNSMSQNSNLPSHPPPPLTKPPPPPPQTSSKPHIIVITKNQQQLNQVKNEDTNESNRQATNVIKQAPKIITFKKKEPLNLLEKLVIKPKTNTDPKPETSITIPIRQPPNPAKQLTITRRINDSKKQTEVPFTFQQALNPLSPSKSNLNIPPAPLFTPPPPPLPKALALPHQPPPPPPPPQPQIQGQVATAQAPPKELSIQEQKHHLHQQIHERIAMIHRRHIRQQSSKYHCLHAFHQIKCVESKAQKQQATPQQESLRKMDFAAFTEYYYEQLERRSSPSLEREFSLVSSQSKQKQLSQHKSNYHESSRKERKNSPVKKSKRDTSRSRSRKYSMSPISHSRSSPISNSKHVKTVKHTYIPAVISIDEQIKLSIEAANAQKDKKVKDLSFLDEIEGYQSPVNNVPTDYWNSTFNNNLQSGVKPGANYKHITNVNRDKDSEEEVLDFDD